MKKILIVVCALLLIAELVTAQKKLATPPMSDVNKLMKTSPAELEAYKQQMLKQTSNQMKQTAAQRNIKMDEMLLPNFKVQLPPKDLPRLSLIPKQPPTLMQLADGLRQSKKSLESVTPEKILEEVKTIAATQTPEQQHTSAIAEFYADKPAQSLLVFINAVLQNPSEVMGWNNLAAIMNMTGLEHKAIPILMNQLQTNANSSLLLNNMGQAYLGLGDIGMAELFLKKCLAEDPMNPEANRSMGMIRFAYKQYEEGMQYFEKELAVAYRKSSMALMRTKNPAFNLLQLRKQHKKIPQKNFVADLQLGLFKLPALPLATDQTNLANIKGSVFFQSVSSEVLFWNHKSMLSEEQIAADGDKPTGLYFYLVDALLQDLQEVYKPDELALLTDLDANHLLSLLKSYETQLANTKCPEIPANATPDVRKAYRRKCCDIQKTIMDAFMSQYNGFVESRAKAKLPVWNEYVNDVINIASLDPTMANKAMAYSTIQNYFNFLASYWTAAQLLDPPMECDARFTTAEADSIIESSRSIDINCPEWLNIELDLQVAKIKADCSKYALEFGKGLQAGYEHSFKTGTTTLSAGIGFKQKFFAGAGGADIKQMAYMSYDNNNNFSDIGLLGKASIKIGDTPFELPGGIKAGGVFAGVEAGYTLGINSGFNSAVKGKGIIADFIKIDKPL